MLLLTSLSASDRVALVIGNNDYDDTGNLSDLGACRRDAQLIRRTLEAVGFSVIVGEDQDRAGMDELLTRFENAIPKGGTAVVYFAGHAIEFDGKNYLLGTNAKLQARSRLTEEAMNAETFASAMLLAGAKSSFLLLDCCRDAPTSSEWLTRGSSRKAGLAQIDVDGDIIIGYAAKPGAAALEPAEAGSNSPYATALAKWIPSGIKHGDVFEKVRQEVNESTGGLQRTWENGSFLEPFYFVSTATSRAAPMASPVPVTVPVLSLADRARGATKEEPFVNSLGLEFIPLPGKPGVLMCRTETRVRDFEKFVKATSYDATEGAYTLESGDWKQAGGSWKDPRFPARATQTPDHPVVCVSWEDAKAFCAWLYNEEGLRYRLPTDEEWSLAVGVGKYPWGNEYPPPRGSGNYANYAGVVANTAERTAPVASYATNRFGFYDLGGNVWEWCEDWARMSMNDPELQKFYQDNGFDDGGGNKFRVLRGGSWGFNDSTYLLSSFRYFYMPSGRFDVFGIRVVLEVGTAPVGTVAPPVRVPTQVPVPSLASQAPGDTKEKPFVNSLGLEFIPVPGKPGVLMCRTETRVRDFERFVKATGYDATVAGWNSAGGNWKDPLFPANATQTPDHPVVCVSWGDVEWFCEWLYAEEGLRYRLPTDEEWSAAVGVGKYPWGNQWPPPAGSGNYAGEEANVGKLRAENLPVISGYQDGAASTAPVASYAPNQFGFYDLGGNVLEWCMDWFRMSMNDPEVQTFLLDNGLNDGGGNKYRVLRGGAWSDGANGSLRSSYRQFETPMLRDASYGFRLVIPSPIRS